MSKRNYKKLVSLGLIIALGGFIIGPVQEAKASALTSMSDTMTRLQADTDSNHTIVFTTPTGVAAAETITVTFPATFDLTGVDFEDIDLNDGSELTLAGTCTTTTWGAAIAGQVLTLTSCTGTISAASTVTIEIGTHATEGVQGVSQIENGDAGSATIAIGGTMTDSGDIAVPIVADDSVNVTAAVDEAISFSISDVTIGFGDLSASTGRWATGDANGGDASAAEPTAAHTLSIGTNATGGYIITYNGATLTTSGSDTIDDADTITGDSDGDPGTEQFGICASRSGDATIASGYQRDATADWDFVESIATTLVSETGPTATETISVSYLANIGTQTEAGAYSTDITYIATSTY